MNVLGEANTGGSKSLIVNLSVIELEHLLGSFYDKPIVGKGLRVSELKAGDKIDIGALHSMTSKLEDVCSALINTNKLFEENAKTIFNFALMVNEHEEATHS